MVRVQYKIELQKKETAFNKLETIHIYKDK